MSIKNSLVSLPAFSRCGFCQIRSNLRRYFDVSKIFQICRQIRTQAKSAPKLAKSSEALEILRII